jgi:hypothetical protein
MKWLLVWWIVCPGHTQAIHYRDFASESACLEYAAQLPTEKQIRWHCSLQ